MRLLVVLVCLALSIPAVAAPYADSVHIPPAAKSVDPASAYPIPQDQVAHYLSHLAQTVTYAHFAGRNDDLKRAATDPHKLLVVGRGLTTDLAPEDLFDAPFQDGVHHIFLGSVASVDAHALRFQVDLSGLADDEEVWVIDLVGHRPFGPYYREDHLDGGRWLPTTEGDTAVLMVRSLRPDLPQVRLEGISHFFRSLDELKVLACNINIACETDPAIQDASAAVGIMVVPRIGGDNALCSGALINNADTPGFEPYYLTSYHCVPDYAGANQVDIVWDFRSTVCGATAAPALSSLPRSAGSRVLATSSALDATLMSLNGVPVGDYGRTYLGWDTEAPFVGDDVIVMHHPDGSHMRISYGDIIRTNVAAIGLGYRNQIEVRWSDGVTEGGSSGSNLLKVASGYRIIGTLSNGPQHTCGANRIGNTDQFSSFRRFYFETDASAYLTGNTPPEDPGGTGCPAEQALKDNPRMIDNLRTFRDRGLKMSPAGWAVVTAYYAATPWTADWARRSEGFRSAVARFAEPLAHIGSLLR